MRHSNKERDNVAESRPGSNTASIIIIIVLLLTKSEVYLSTSPLVRPLVKIAAD